MPETNGAQAAIPGDITEPDLPIVLPICGEGQTTDPDAGRADATKGRKPDVRVVDLSEDEEESPERARRRPREGTQNAPVQQNCARVTACNRGRARNRSPGRRQRKRKNVTRSQNDHSPSPGRRAEGETFTLADGLRRTQGAICAHCGYANHTVRDCSRRRLAHRRSNTPNARAARSPHSRASTRPGAPGRRAPHSGRRDPPASPRVTFRDTTGYHSADNDSPARNSTPPKRRSVHDRLGRVGDRRGDNGRRSGIPQIDGAEEIIRSRSPSLHPPGSEGEEDIDALPRGHRRRDLDDEIPDLTSSSGEEDEETSEAGSSDWSGYESPAWDPPERGTTTAPLTHPGYHITALAVGRLQRFLIDSGLPFSCIRQDDLHRIRQSAHADFVRPAWGGGVTIRLLFLHLGTREVTLQVLPRDSELESSLGWDTLAENGNLKKHKL